MSICREYLEQRNPESKGDRDVEKALGSPHRREQSQGKELTVNGYNVSFSGDENVLELERGGIKHCTK